MRRALILLVLLVVPASAHADRIGHMERLAEDRYGIDLQVRTAGFPWGKIGESDLPGGEVAITDERLSRKDTCLVVMHEAGHKAGLPHSGDPRSIMFPRPLEVNFQPCLRFDLLEIRLDVLRDDLSTARHFDHDRSIAHRLARRVRRVRRLLGP